MLNTAHPGSVRTIKSDEFLPPIQRWITLGGLLLISAVSISAITSAIMKYNIAVKANATIRPAGELRLVQTMIEGSVKQIVVKENQEVKQGDAIAYLDDTKLQIQASQLQSSIQQSRLQLAQLDAQVRSMDSQILAEAQSIERVVAGAEVEINRYQREYDERQLATQADFQETKVALESAQDELMRYQDLAGTGAISELQLKQKQSAVQTAEAKLDRTQAALNPSQASVRVAQEQVAQQQARGKATLASLNKERQALNQRRSEIQNQLIRDQKELEQAVREVKRSVIRAPSSGTIFQLKLQNANQVVRPGDTVAQITPNQAPLIAKATVANQDIDKVAIGQTVQMRVNACAYPDYGILKGKVMTIAPDATPRTQAEGTTTTAQTGNDRTYEVIIQPETALLVNGSRQCQIQAGMDASASIISSEETFLQFMLRKARLSTDL